MLILPIFHQQIATIEELLFRPRRHVPEISVRMHSAEPTAVFVRACQPLSIEHDHLWSVEPFGVSQYCSGCQEAHISSRTVHQELTCAVLENRTSLAFGVRPQRKWTISRVFVDRSREPAVAAAPVYSCRLFDDGSAKWYGWSSCPDPAARRARYLGDPSMTNPGPADVLKAHRTLRCCPSCASS